MHLHLSARYLRSPPPPPTGFPSFCSRSTSFLTFNLTLGEAFISYRFSVLSLRYSKGQSRHWSMMAIHNRPKQMSHGEHRVNGLWPMSNGSVLCDKYLRHSKCVSYPVSMAVLTPMQTNVRASIVLASIGRPSQTRSVHYVTVTLNSKVCAH